MNDWIIWASAQRHDEVLREAMQVRLRRRAHGAGGGLLRGHVADSALVLSRALEHFAHTVRAKA